MKHEGQSVAKIPFNGHAKAQEAYSYLAQHYTEIYNLPAFNLDVFLALSKHENAHFTLYFTQLP